MNVVVISQNQSEWLQPMFEAIKSYRHVFVLDRCTDDSEAVLKSLGANYITNHEGEGFLAGRMRNLGLAALGDVRDTLFLDGDRVPVNFAVETYEEALRLYDITLAKIKNDCRGFSNQFVYNAMFGQKRSEVYSCGILLRESAIKKIQDFQKGHLFSPLFDGWYAGEDEYLGCVAYYLDLTCGKFPLRYYLTGDPFKTTVSEPTRSYYYNLRDELLFNQGPQSYYDKEPPTSPK